MTARSIMVMLSHDGTGGAGEIMANIAEGLAARGNRVTLASLYPNPRTTLATRIPLRHVFPKRPRGPLAGIGMAGALRRFLHRERPDHIVSALPAANVMVPPAAWIAGLGRRVILTHHSPAETHNPWLNRVDTATGAMPSVARIVSVSHAVADSLSVKPAGYRAKRVTIHNALPPDLEVRLAALAPAERKARSRRVIAVGRLAEQKNHDLLIHSARRLRDITVDIVGDGEERERLRALVERLGVGDRVAFHGHVPRERAVELMADADAFVQVSLFEGHSLALVEAAKLGLPLIVSDVPSQIEGVTAPDGARCAAVVALGDDAGLARAIQTLIDDPAAYARQHALSLKLGEAATFDRMIDRYEALMRP